mmetsp:Transcript_6084/g.17015  ORF Transcript_6084/g.17015 Transcript_6084/m.17015 type:complete len:248 (-) Transcript_6084:2493-3236(-)
MQLADCELEADGVDRQHVLARVILQLAGQKRLREKEATDPVRGRRGVGVDPVLQELALVEELREKRSKGLERGVSVVPELGDLLTIDAVGHRLELAGHHHETLESAFDLAKRAADFGQQALEASALLLEQGVHALLVSSGELHRNAFQVKIERQRFLHLNDVVVDDVFARRAATTRAAWLEQLQGVQRLERVRQRIADVCVIMHSEHFWAGIHGQAFDVLHVAAVRGALVHLDALIDARLAKLVPVL